MQNADKKYWENKWCSTDSTVNNFAKRTVAFLRTKMSNKRIKLLDLGCGDGKDACLFAKNGFEVVAVDFSESAIEKLKSELSENPHLCVKAQKRDISKKLSFKDRSFDVVYAHLSLYYFDAKTTSKIFDEVHRVLKRDGLFFIKCKSVDDVLYGKGEKIEKDVFWYKHIRHFFSKKYMKAVLQQFSILRIRCNRSFHGSYKAAYIEAIAQKK